MKRLHKYLALDLVKTAVMSTAAFTLMMTVIGILEPLRKQGLAAREVAAVLGLTFMLMLSLALPIATLFAATIVYGRFSQDNELTACRASGVSTIGVLKPALWIGGVVTVVSLMLTNIIVPHMARGAGPAMYANMQGVFFNVISKRGTFDLSNDVVIRAEGVDLSNNVLIGAVVMRTRENRPLKMDKITGQPIAEEVPFAVVAEARVLGFATTPEGDVYVRIRHVDARGEGREQLGIAEESGVGEWGPLPDPIEKTSSLWSDWPSLWASLKDPTLYPEIGKKLREYRREIGNEMFTREVVQAITDGQPYRGLGSEGVRYEIRAAEAVIDGPSAVALKGKTGPDGRRALVEVREIHADGRTTVGTAACGAIETSWSEFRNVSMVTITLSPPAWESGDAGADESRHDRPWVRGGELSLPEHISAKQDSIALKDLLEDTPRFTRNQKIISEIAYLREDRVPKHNNDTIALMHFRVSYGASCFLMVAMGAALGLMFRGGQVLAAFALALIPVAVVGFMAVMGYGMVRNPDVPTVTGLSCMWGGIAMILAANAAIYLHLSRK